MGLEFDIRLLKFTKDALGFIINSLYFYYKSSGNKE
jgi:hypothetical protein